MKTGFVFLSLIFFSVFALFSKEKCEYSFDPSTTKVKFAAFKFTEKARVEGQFDSFKVIGNPSAFSMQDLARKVKFSVLVESINTGNAERDGKIKKYFFNEMKNTKELSGYFRNIKISNQSGTGELVLRMNQRERSVPVTLTLNDTEVKLQGSLDVLDWNAQKSLESLNRECSALHTGKDGVSKLWSEVEISLITQLKKSCK